MLQVSTYSSDCEDHGAKLPDKKELQVLTRFLLSSQKSLLLQRAVAHLKETLEGRMEKMKRKESEKASTNQSEIKAVVHRAETPHLAGKTLDSDSIKQYQAIKQNSTSKRWENSGVFCHICVWISNIAMFLSLKRTQCLCDNFWLASNEELLNCPLNAS